VLVPPNHGWSSEGSDQLIDRPTPS
jgi:hypothetical protein